MPVASAPLHLAMGGDEARAHLQASTPSPTAAVAVVVDGAADAAVDATTPGSSTPVPVQPRGAIFCNNNPLRGSSSRLRLFIHVRGRH